MTILIKYVAVLGCSGDLLGKEAKRAGHGPYPFQVPRQVGGVQGKASKAPSR